MTPWQWLKERARSMFARVPEDPRRQVRFVIPYDVAGVRLTADDTMSLAAVWACIDVITRSIASCRWNIYEPLAGTNRRRLLAYDMKTWMLNTRPNTEMTAIGFREAMLFQAIPFGNAYAEIVRDRGGRVIQMWPLMSDRMYPQRDPVTKALIYVYTNIDGSQTTLASEDIFHVRGPGMYGLMGDNLVARAAKSIAVAAAQERFSAAFFGQGANPGGVLTFPGQLGVDQHARLKEDWEEKHKGPENAHKPLILESGMQWQTTSIDPQKSQLVEGRKFSVEEICRWFGVPPHKVQHLEHATFSNIEHSSIEFVRDALTPWAVRLQQEADFKLFDQTRAPWRYTELDLRPLTRGDAQSRALAQASWRQNGIMSSNEIRAMEGLDDCGDDGDVLIVQSNMTTIEKILNPPQPALLPGQAPPPPGSTDDLDLNPDTEPDADEAPDSPEDPSEPSREQAMARKAVLAAVNGAMSRYGKRLRNRRAGLNGKKDVGLSAFKRDQLTTIFDELRPFSNIFGAAIGRVLNEEDVVKLMNGYERGDQLGFEEGEIVPLKLEA
jgi:HK97 family phage portal protein